MFEQANPAVALLQSAGNSAVAPDGTQWWTFSGEVALDGGMALAGVVARVNGDDASTCFGETTLGTPAFDPSPLGASLILVPLAMVQVPSGLWSYYEVLELDASQPFGVRVGGYGVAPSDGGRFSPTSSLLWAGDAPSYGTGAVAFDGGVFVYGCAALDGGGNACFAAEAPEDALDDSSAYSYYAASGRMTADPAQAQPLLLNASSVSVFPHPSGRWLATYTAPLAGTVTIRSALGPLGPFSQPAELLACALGPNDFCVGGIQHPELELDAGEVVVSYVAATFGPESAPAYWPRLATVPLPPALP